MHAALACKHFTSAPLALCPSQLDTRCHCARRASTAVFIKYKVHHRPMSISPFTINGGSAAAGGEASSLLNDDPVTPDFDADKGEGEEQQGDFELHLLPA